MLISTFNHQLFKVNRIQLPGSGNGVLAEDFVFVLNEVRGSKIFCKKILEPCLALSGFHHLTEHH